MVRREKKEDGREMEGGKVEKKKTKVELMILRRKVNGREEEDEMEGRRRKWSHSGNVGEMGR